MHNRSLISTTVKVINNILKQQFYFFLLLPNQSVDRNIFPLFIWLILLANEINNVFTIDSFM